VVLPALMVAYVGSGVLTRVAGSIRRRIRRGGATPAVERKIG